MFLCQGDAVGRQTEIARANFICCGTCIHVYVGICVYATRTGRIPGGGSKLCGRILSYADHANVDETAHRPGSFVPSTRTHTRTQLQIAEIEITRPIFCLLYYTRPANSRGRLYLVSMPIFQVIIRSVSR